MPDPSDPPGPDAEPGADVSRAVVVVNPNDDVAAVRRLRALAGPGRLVVHPSPGGRSIDLANDILTAAGKSPALLIQDNIGTAESWAAVTAWLHADGVRDVLVDRAHRLSTYCLRHLCDAVQPTGATLWLIWPQGPRIAKPSPLADILFSCGFASTFLAFEDFLTALPLPRPATETEPGPRAHAPRPAAHGPPLPLADFPLFLAVCRRHLAADTFAALRTLYDREYEATQRWLFGALARARSDADLVPVLTTHLRDHRLGPAPTPGEALIRLRAIQAALWQDGLGLRWQPDNLGPDPAARLRNALSPRVADKIRTAAPTWTAAAVALSLYLGCSPDGFGLITCGQIADDGASFHVPLPAPDAAHLPTPWGDPDRNPIRPLPSETPYVPREALRHLATDRPVHLPAHAQPLLAAHLAYRRSQGAGPDDPYFLHPRAPGRKNPARCLRDAILRTCQRIHLAPTWLHHPNCRRGEDIGASAPTPGWLAQRALDFAPLDAPDHPHGNPAP
ncbi:hypothetical protein OG216_47650 (plasmid) [Streptomycetaceae bacterium NBC_01309]